MRCLCYTSTWLFITKPQTLAAGHVRLHCPWPWWTRKDISPFEAFTDSCQPEHLVATAPDTVSRWENTTALTGILILSFTLLPGQLGAHSYLPIPFARQRRPPCSGGAHVYPSSMSFCTRPRTPWDQDPWGLDTSRCLCPWGVALSEPPKGPGTRQALCVWPEETAETSGHNASAAWGCPRGKQGWRFCYCLNKKNHSWRQQSSYQYFCRIKIQVSKDGVSLKLDLKQTA